MLLTVNNLHVPLAQGEPLQDISFSLDSGACVVIRTEVLQIGTELLQALLGMASDAEGEIRFDGLDVLHTRRRELQLRMRADMGIVYRAGGLISTFNVAENIGLALGYHHNVTLRELQARVTKVAEELHIIELLTHPVHSLNPDQARLVNLARELVRRPRLLLIDAILDGLPERYHELVVDSVDHLRCEHDAAVLMTTRRQHLLRETRVLTLHDGSLTGAAA